MTAPASPSSAHKFAYQPALDGLRAVAVIIVLLYHAGVSWIPGGFLGVDLFFVLSGYLITGLLWTEYSNSGRIDLKGFWVRRIRRLVPALILVLIGVAAYATWFADPMALTSLSRDVIGSLLYVPNWVSIFNGSSYFEQFSSTPSPLKHMWSLGVEEQFYLLWPIVFLLAVKRFKNTRLLTVLLASGAVASGLLMAVLHTGGDPSRVYYGTDTRAQALLLGAALAMWLHPRVQQDGTLQNVSSVRTVGWVGAAALLGFVFTVGDDVPWMYEGGFFAAALFCALTVAAAVQPVGILRSTLSWRPLREIGKVSYGLYLWHWPVFVTMTPARMNMDGLSLIVARITVTVAFTLVSYHLVEMPIREKRFVRKLPVMQLTSAAALTGVFVLFAVQVAEPAEQVVTFEEMSKEVTSPDTPTGSEPKEPPFTSPVTEPPSTTPNSTTTTEPVYQRPLRLFIAGDSSALTLSYFRGKAIENADYVMDAAVINGCAITRGHALIGDQFAGADPKCERWEDYWEEKFVPFNPDLSLIVLGAWEVMDRRVDGQDLRVFSKEYERYLHNELNAAFNLLSSRGGKVAIMEVPCFGVPENNLSEGSVPRNDMSRVAWVNDIIRSAVTAHPANPMIIPSQSLLCPNGKYEKTIDGIVVREDGVHYTEEGAPYVWNKLLIPALNTIRPQQFTTP